MTKVAKTINFYGQPITIEMDEVEWAMTVYVNRSRKGLRPVYHTNPNCKKIAADTEVVQMTRFEAISRKDAQNGSYGNQVMCEHCKRTHNGYIGY